MLEELRIYNTTLNRNNKAQPKNMKEISNEWIAVRIKKNQSQRQNH